MKKLGLNSKEITGSAIEEINSLEGWFMNC